MKFCIPLCMLDSCKKRDFDHLIGGEQAGSRGQNIRKLWASCQGLSTCYSERWPWPGEDAIYIYIYIPCRACQQFVSDLLHLMSMFQQPLSPPQATHKNIKWNGAVLTPSLYRHGGGDIACEGLHKKFEMAEINRWDDNGLSPNYSLNGHPSGSSSRQQFFPQSSSIHPYLVPKCSVNFPASVQADFHWAGLQMKAQSHKIHTFK